MVLNKMSGLRDAMNVTIILVTTVLFKKRKKSKKKFPVKRVRI